MQKKKSLGQHFLKDKAILKRICEAIPAAENDRLIEIGGGEGALTEFLAGKYEDLHVLEIDKRAVKILKNRFPGVHINQADVMKANWSELLNTRSPVHVVGNLPYYLTSPILFLLLDMRQSIRTSTLMMQQEVAERITGEAGNKKYGILSVQLQLLSTAEYLFEVPPSAFSPPPRVDSAVVRFSYDRKKPVCQINNLKKVVKTAFNQRRKKLSNALAPLIGNYQPESIDLNKRAEKLTPQQYVMLTEELEKNDIL